MTTASNSTVVRLDAHPLRTAEGRQQFEEAMRRHPSFQSRERDVVLPQPATRVTQLATVHDIEARRARTALEHAAVDETG